MREVPSLDDQPMPGDTPAQMGEPCCVELTAPGGQLVAMLLIQRVPVEDVVLSVLPTFRAQTGVTAPLSFKVRALSEAEQAALQAMPAAARPELNP
jgi:hypothetical protein